MSAYPICTQHFGNLRCDFLLSGTCYHLHRSWIARIKPTGDNANLPEKRKRNMWRTSERCSDHLISPPTQIVTAIDIKLEGWSLTTLSDYQEDATGEVVGYVVVNVDAEHLVFGPGLFKSSTPIAFIHIISQSEGFWWKFLIHWFICKFEKFSWSTYIVNRAMNVY